MRWDPLANSVPAATPKFSSCYRAPERKVELSARKCENLEHRVDLFLPSHHEYKTKSNNSTITSVFTLFLHTDIIFIVIFVYYIYRGFSQTPLRVFEANFLWSVQYYSMESFGACFVSVLTGRFFFLYLSLLFCFLIPVLSFVPHFFHVFGSFFF